ncbi:MAG: hypothetical protein Q9180_001979 [Flavoplaca navasiana]
MRHKQWASCNGLRDPATYVKRSDLITPKGIDHDYNYLTSIERQLDTAERDAESKGILLYEGKQDGLKAKVHQPSKGELPLQNALKQCRIVVDRAPKGKRIIWTVEWVHRNGTREIGRCPETEPFDLAYAKLVDSRAIQNNIKAGPTPMPPKKKHKPNRAMSKSTVMTPITPPEDSSSGHVNSLSALEPSKSPTVFNEGVPAPSTAGLNSATDTPDPESEKLLLPSPKSDQASVPHLYFYLLLPSTPTSYRVLTPLASNDSLASALKERLVLEFPTIYALKQPPDKLPKGFMNEEEYLRSISEKTHLEKHLDGLLSEAQGWGRDELDGDGNKDFDPKALQDVLKRDLISVVDTV